MIKSDYVRVREAESLELLHGFLDEPVNTCGAVCDYGVRCATYDDPAMREMEEIMDLITEMSSPGGTVSMAVYLPGFINVSWKAKANQLGKRLDKYYGALAENGWGRGASGYNANNLAYKLSLHEVVGVILTCILALIHDPAIQRRT
ncbi:unnamed protein product [Rhizoctonia solani]|uniref:Uncharacterized protein n=1 Tax=Rhizoctonia solani TaxID=456999 RepID=A0A8H3B9N4_9AGAM|nr:unnamed protein product [Rhizoctonia solani]